MLKSYFNLLPAVCAGSNCVRISARRGLGNRVEYQILSTKFILDNPSGRAV